MKLRSVPIIVNNTMRANVKNLIFSNRRRLRPLKNFRNFRSLDGGGSADRLTPLDISPLIFSCNFSNSSRVIICPRYIVEIIIFIAVDKDL